MARSKIKKYGNRNYWQVQDEWAGDAVLNFLGRIALTQQYPKDTIQSLNVRLEYFKSNEFLEEFCKKHGLRRLNADDLERSLYYLTLENFGAARAMVAEMVEYFDQSGYLTRMLNQHKNSRNQHYQSRYQIGFAPTDCKVCKTNTLKVNKYTERQRYGVMCAFCHKESFGLTPQEAFAEWNKGNTGLVDLSTIFAGLENKETIDNHVIQ